MGGIGRTTEDREFSLSPLKFAPTSRTTAIANGSFDLVPFHPFTEGQFMQTCKLRRDFPSPIASTVPNCVRYADLATS
jgi:hypothetical protein